jgi:hypothetical protein
MYSVSKFFYPLVRLVTIVWVAVSSALCLYQGMSYVYPIESHSLNILMPKRLRFFGMYCLRTTLPLTFTMTNYCQMFGTVVKL